MTQPIVSGSVTAIKASLFALRAQLSIATQTEPDAKKKAQLTQILADVQSYLDDA